MPSRKVINDPNYLADTISLAEPFCHFTLCIQVECSRNDLTVALLLASLLSNNLTVPSPNPATNREGDVGLEAIDVNGLSI